MGYRFYGFTRHPRKRFEVVEAQGLARQIQEQIDTFLQELAALENNSTATVEDIEQLRADIQQLEEELLRLQASAMEQEGNNVRQFIGDGQRQYLSGMYLGGQRILILLDSSASMLDSTLVNIIRTRNMSVANKRNAEKWQRAVKTVDWISTQLPITSRYQIWNFSDEVGSVLPGMDEIWLEVADRDHPNLIVLDIILPRKNGFQVCRKLRSESNTEDIGIVMLSSKNQDHDRLWAERQGADGYLTKPYNAEELLSCINAVLTKVDSDTEFSGQPAVTATE